MPDAEEYADTLVQKLRQAGYEAHAGGRKGLVYFWDTSRTLEESGWWDSIRGSDVWEGFVNPFAEEVEHPLEVMFGFVIRPDEDPRFVILHNMHRALHPRRKFSVYMVPREVKTCNGLELARFVQAHHLGIVVPEWSIFPKYPSLDLSIGAEFLHTPPSRIVRDDSGRN